MALTFALLFNPRVLGGLTFHETAGLAIGAAILTHILLNYRWVKNVTLKIFDQKLSGKVRFSYLVNLLLLISMTAIIVTGIFISRVLFPTISVGDNHMIRGLHNMASYLTLALVGIHLGLHWQWVMNVWKKMLDLKSGKPRKGVIATAIVAIVLLIGGYQLYTAKFTSSTTGVNSQQTQFNRGGQGLDNASTEVSNQSATPDSSFSPAQGTSGDRNNNFQGQVNGDFGGRHGHDGGRGGQGALPVIITYFGIMAVIIIPTYYLEKRILRKKRKLKEIHNQNLVESH